MPNQIDGETIARQRIAEEAERQTGFLDLGGLGLTRLPDELFSLLHLRTLNLGVWIRLEDGTRHRARFSPRNHLAGDLARLEHLPALKALSLAYTHLSSLTPLAGLIALTRLDCSRTQVTELTPLAGLTALTSLDCSRTQVTELTLLAGLTALTSLDCSRTQVTELTPLAGLTALTSLNCSHTQVTELTPLAGLTALTSLDCSFTQVTELTSLAGLTALTSLNCSYTQVTELTPLAGLTALTSLNCWGTQVTELTPLAGLTTLTRLNCSDTQVAELTPLASLTALTSLDCSDTQVAELTPLAGLSALTSLDCSRTQVTELTPLIGLTTLTRLNCSDTQVAELTPLADLTALTSLNCSHTQVTELTPLAGLTALTSLNCSYTQVTELTPLAGLTALTSLDCSHTQVTELTPLAGITALTSLDCSGCALSGLPRPLRDLPSLSELFLFDCRIPEVPAEVLSRGHGDNCLASVRAHFRDLDAGAEPSTDVKLIVLGNGRVGKTQICRRLRDEPYDEAEKSTHGVLVTSAPLVTDEPPPVRLNIWDFGGQDLYHGTHALFLRTTAIFLLVWARDTEDAAEHTHQGIVFRNQRLPYWLAFVRHLGSADSPVRIVQTRCDRPQDEALSPPIPADAVEPGRDAFVHYSALNDRGRAELDRRLREAVAWLRERQGTALIGAGRLRVQRALQALRDADSAVEQPEQRQYRTITQQHFAALCDEAGGISSHGHLLSYLHNTGIVFYRPGMFGDRIVLDQGWALDAVYAVFNREKCYRELKRLRGRFTRPLLESLVWSEHEEKEQRLFLDMMLSCGVCFVHRQGPKGDDDATEYIAPDLLPERAEIQAELDGRWDKDQPTETETFEYEMLHPGLVRGIIAGIGGEAGVDALYWRGGLCVYETRTRSHALIEQDMDDAWHGKIRLSTQGGQAAVLCQQLADWIERRTGRDAPRARRIAPTVQPRPRADDDEAVPADDRPPGHFGPITVSATAYFVSYAWDDDSPGGTKREAEVDRLRAAAQTRGIVVQRDKTVLRNGDSILAFMRRMGRGDRVFVFLSEKYLHSAWCMTELLEIWTHSRGDDADFLRRVRVFCLPDARISTLADRVELAVWWKRQFERVDALNREHGIAVLGTEGVRELYAMMRFYQHVADILHLISDTVRPRAFEEFERYGFDDPPPDGDDDGS